jgi:uncharacterized protein YkwD/uncharacterized membrane protein
MAVATKQKPKQTTHHRKRAGTHQKRSDHFVKTYWPYIPLVAIVGIGMFFNNLLANPAGVLSYATNTTAVGLLENTNKQRATQQLGSLAISDKLSQAAQAKAQDMVARDYWSHKTPDGQEPWAFINTTGYTYTAAGENLAYGFANSDENIQGWMNSKSHRENMLNKGYTEVGFGIANSPSYQGKGEQTIVVALYATPSTNNVQANSAVQGPTEPIATNQNSQGTFKVSGTVPGEVKVSRVALVSGDVAHISSYIFVAILAIFATVLFYRHSKAWHKTLRRGEKFVLTHKVLDILLVSGIMMSIILLGTAGSLL